MKIRGWTDTQADEQDRECWDTHILHTVHMLVPNLQMVPKQPGVHKEKNRQKLNLVHFIKMNMTWEKPPKIYNYKTSTNQNQIMTLLQVLKGLNNTEQPKKKATANKPVLKCGKHIGQ